MSTVSRRRGFTLIELLVVIAIIAILAAILFPVFAKARSQARKTVCISNMKQIGLSILMYAQDYDETCGFERYQNAYNPGPPVGYTWRYSLYPYLKNNQIWHCPEDTRNVGWNEGYLDQQQYLGVNHYMANGADPAVNPDTHMTYAYNGAIFDSAGGIKLAKFQAPAQVLLLLESRMEYPDLGWWCTPWDLSGAFQLTGAGAWNNHDGMCVWAFADGHVKTMKMLATATPTWMWYEGPLNQDNYNQFVNGINQVNTEYK